MKNYFQNYSNKASFCLIVKMDLFYKNTRILERFSEKLSKEIMEKTYLENNLHEIYEYLTNNEIKSNIFRFIFHTILQINFKIAVDNRYKNASLFQKLLENGRFLNISIYDVAVAYYEINFDVFELFLAKYMLQCQDSTICDFFIIDLKSRMVKQSIKASKKHVKAKLQVRKRRNTLPIDFTKEKISNSNTIDFQKEIENFKTNKKYHTFAGDSTHSNEFKFDKTVNQEEKKNGKTFFSGIKSLFTHRSESCPVKKSRSTFYIKRDKGPIVFAKRSLSCSKLTKLDTKDAAIKMLEEFSFKTIYQSYNLENNYLDGYCLKITHDQNNYGQIISYLNSLKQDFHQFLQIQQ